MNQNSTNRPSKACGCPDFEMSRRGFLGGVAAATGVMTAGSLFGDAFQQVSYGAAPGGNVQTSANSVAHAGSVVSSAQWPSVNKGNTALVVSASQASRC